MPYMGKTALADITPQQIKDWHTLLLKSVSNTTARYAHTVLKAALEAAVRESLLQTNVAKLVKPPARVKKQVNWLEWDHAEKVIEVTADHRYGLYFAIALSTGMARSEVLGLRWKDIDFEEKKIYIRQTYIKTNGGNYFQESAKTAGRLRTIDIGSKLIERLNTWQEQQAIEMEALGYKTDLVLCTNTGQPVNPSNLHLYITRITEKHNLPPFSTHSLRHTHATRLLNLGEHPKVVSERLGHASIKITMDTYSHVSPRLFQKAAEATDL